MKVMMVCTGNICRSAMAQYVLEAALREAGVSGVEVDSCGISNEEAGNPIDRRAARILSEHGYQVPRNHHAKQVQRQDFSQCDLMLAMTSHHLSALERMQEHYGTKADLRMYRSFDPQTVAGERAYADSQDFAGARRRDLDVPDPWYGDLSDFEDTLAVVERVTPHLVAYLTELSTTAG